MDVEVIGTALDEALVRKACVLAAGSAGIEDAHVAIEFVDAVRIAELNAEFRGKEGPTDVLSFPVDEHGPAHGPRELFQLVLTDLPGVQRPRDALTERMQRRVETELAESDAALMVLNGEQGVGGPGDRFIAEALSGAKVPVVIAVNKVDAIRRDPTVAALQAADDLGLDAEVFPISARTGRGVAELTEHLAALLPEGPFYFPPEEVPTSPRR